MTLLLLVAACSGPSPAPGAPYAGVFAALDDDHDGRVTDAEYAAAAPNVAPPFAEVDLDGDGSLAPDEIATLVHRLDPAKYDPALMPASADGGRQAPGRRGGEPPSALTGGGFDGSGPPLAGGEASAAPHRETRPGPAGKAPRRPEPRRPNERDDGLGDALLFELEEVRARVPGADVPTAEELRAALAADPAGEATRAMAARIHAAATAAGLQWPEGLPG